MRRRKSRKLRAQGAEILYSEILCCELRDGLVHIDAASATHVEHGVLPLPVAMRLYQALGVALSQARAECVEIFQSRAVKHH